MTQTLDPLSLYRLPWNYADNGISWLEPTTQCNLRCEGCYRDLDNPVHKSLAEARADLEVFKRLRKSDCMSIAGGDPLVYPDIVALVRMVKEMGWKPIINTNGLALTEALLKDLKQAGVFGFTFHIDTSQNRPRAKHKTETELNEVRQHYAEMLAREGGLACSFNATVTQATLGDVPDLVRWAQKNADIVQTMVFILFRSPDIAGDHDTYVGARKLDLRSTYKPTEWGGSECVYAADVVDKIRQADPLYQPSAYLNGTASPDSFKWLLANRVVLNGETMGYLSPRIMELIQTFSHLFNGRYLAYASPWSTAQAKLLTFLGAAVDQRARRIFGRIFGRMLTHPADLLRRARVQSIMIIQPVNFDDSGHQDMCDGCPDITVHDGRLVWSCRLEELNKYGAFVTTAPRLAACTSTSSPTSPAPGVPSA